MPHYRKMSTLRRTLLLAVVSVFLAGCSATPATTAGSTFVPTATASYTTAAPSPVITPTAPTPSPLATPTPSATAAAVSPTPAPSPTPVGENLPFPKPDAGNRSQISSVAVAFANFVYYRRDEGTGSAVFSRIIVFDKKTKTEKELLNTKGRGCIAELFMDDSGTLYYLVSADNNTDTNRILYRYRQGKSDPMAKDVCLLLYAGRDQLYYSRGWDKNYIPSGFAVLSLKTGEEKSISGDCRMADFLRYGSQAISQNSNGSSTEFSLKDIASNSTAKLQVQASMKNVTNTFVEDGRLFAVDYDEDAQQSKIYSIDMATGKILWVVPVNGRFGDYEIYENKLYFFSSRVDENENVIDQKISVLDQSTGKLSAFATFTLLDSHLSWPVLVEAGGYLWCCREWDADGVFLDYVRKIELG